MQYYFSVQHSRDEGFGDWSWYLRYWRMEIAQLNKTQRNSLRKWFCPFLLSHFLLLRTFFYYFFVQSRLMEEHTGREKKKTTTINKVYCRAWIWSLYIFLSLFSFPNMMVDSSVYKSLKRIEMKVVLFVILSFNLTSFHFYITLLSVWEKKVEVKIISSPLK